MKKSAVIGTLALLTLSVVTSLNVYADQISPHHAVKSLNTSIVNGDFSNGLLGWDSIILNPSNSIKVVTDKDGNFAELVSIKNMTALTQEVTLTKSTPASIKYSLKGKGHVLISLSDGTVIVNEKIYQASWREYTLNSGINESKTLKLSYSTDTNERLDVKNVTVGQ